MRKQKNFSLPVFVNMVCLSAAFYISVLLGFFLSFFPLSLFLSILIIIHVVIRLSTHQRFKHRIIEW